MARLGVVISVVAIALASVASTASAGSSLLGLGNDCGQASQPFAPWGDYKSYTFGANGGLENGSSGWSLSGPARVVRGNESYYVHSRYDDSSLSLSAGSVVYTPKLCMGTTSTWLRFFARSSNDGTVRVQVVLRNLLGDVLAIVQISDLSPGQSWQPGPDILNLDSLLGLVGVSSIQLKFIALDGTVQIDDVYVDPWAWRG
ncbi:MAG: hypothetical protein ACJ74D_01745 [Gaiellaceae bacterium]